MYSDSLLAVAAERAFLDGGAAPGVLLPSPADQAAQRYRCDPGQLSRRLAHADPLCRGAPRIETVSGYVPLPTSFSAKA